MVAYDNLELRLKVKINKLYISGCHNIVNHVVVNHRNARPFTEMVNQGEFCPRFRRLLSCSEHRWSGRPAALSEGAYLVDGIDLEVMTLQRLVGRASAYQIAVAVSASRAATYP